MECPRCGRLPGNGHTEICALQGEIERLRHDIERHIAMASELATENERLRAELAECRSKPQELHLHANGDSTDCRSCQRAYQSGHGYFCGLSYRAVPTVCINGDGYVPADPVRLYETEREV